MEKCGLASRWKQVLSPTLGIMKPEQRLSLLQMILLRHLKAGFGKKGGYRRCDCDGYRPDTSEGKVTRQTSWTAVEWRVTCVSLLDLGA